jgi:2-polyprenyl-3-methyl-5-hydroxy-6-metoxy-1,4-benzoquinol methylase
VGCGEGYWVINWTQKGLSAIGSDFSKSVIEIAKGNSGERGLPASLFMQKSVYDLTPETDSADLIVCCEVLEHLEQPERALRVLKSLARKYVILSVPREPLWSVMNLSRGKYWFDLGNTPGHIQRWSQRSFIKLVSRHFRIEKVLAPIPWTMLHCRPFRNSG